MRDTLLLACGSAENRAELRSIFEENYNILEAETGKQAMLLLEQNLHCIAALLLDLSVASKGGHALLRDVTSDQQLSEVPLLVILGEGSRIDEATAFSMGADDVIVQPCDTVVTQSRVQTIVDLNRHKWHLQELLDEQTDVLRHSNEVMVDALSSIIEYRSVESGQHILRIRRFTRILLDEVARTCPEYNLDETTIGIIASASALHDIGKIAIPDSILNKPGPLTPEERSVMQTHSFTGCQILESLSGTGNEEYLRYAHNICHYHHERWDGNGYPEGLAGDDIPICAQVVGLADVYDALTMDRVYKEAYSFDRAANMILGGECGVFSPKLLDCFKQVSLQMSLLATEYADGRSPKSDHITVPLPGPTPQTGIDTLHMTQMKYNALLHHINVMVAEADLDQGIFHIVYNPDPNLSALHSGRNFEETERILLEQIVYPEDREILEDILHRQIPQFLTDGLRRQARSFRVRSKRGPEPEFYRVTTLRLNLSDPTSRKLLVLWEKAHVDDESVHTAIPEWRNEFSGENVFGGIACFACCHNDRYLTLARFGSNLTALLGYTAEEFQTLFQGQMIRLVCPEDRKRVLDAIAEQLTHRSSLELEYRLRHKDGCTIWVVTKGQLITGADGIELLYCAILDISRAMASHEALLETLERHQVILSQTESVIFEWDVATDSMQYFGDWESIFGYPPLKQGFVARLETDSHFHPEDIPLLRNMMQKLRCGERYQTTEARLVKADGRYLWCRLRVTTRFDEKGLPCKAVGLITNIDQEKRNSQFLQNQAERDPLTKLLNKDAVRKYAEEHLSSAAPSVHAALMIIDLDNFKLVNDRHGHLFGDAVLSQTAARLRKLFRSDDIVARIGGDEFLVLMKGNPSVDLVRDRCRRLVDTLRRQLQSLAPDCDLSCTVGVALSPDHGTGYTELFRHADQALYLAKSRGKNTFLLYDAKSPAFLTQRKHTSAINERIDSDEQPGLAENSLTQYAFQRLYEADDLDEAMDHILSVVGQQMNVSRVYVFENNPENTHCSNTYEWCNEGIRPEIHNLQNISYEEDIPQYKNHLSEHGILYCTDISQLSQDLYDILAPQGIKSLLHCAIYDRGVFRGYVGFDDCESNRLWTQDQIDALTFFSEMLAVFLLKQRAQEETQRYADDLASVLDNQNAWIYVIDPDDCTLKFLNAKTHALAPGAQPGMKCYQCLMGREERCPECPAANIKELKNNQITIDNLYLGLRVDAESTLIHWGGSEACLLTCREVKKTSN